MTVNTLGVCNAHMPNEQAIEIVSDTLAEIGLSVDKVRIVNGGAATIFFTDDDRINRNMWLFIRDSGDSGPEPGGPQVVWDIRADWEWSVEVAAAIGLAMLQFGSVWICEADVNDEWREIARLEVGE